MNEYSVGSFNPCGTKITSEPSFSILFDAANSVLAKPRALVDTKAASHQPLFAKQGNAFQDVARQITALSAQPRPSELPVADEAHAPTLEEELFEATAAAKILTSQVAMYLDATWRKKIFSQIDSLHDVSEWEKGDAPLRSESFSTFLKALFLLRPSVRPGLGLSMRGYLIAAWTSNEKRLTIEFLPKDKVRWVASISSEGETEYAASEMTVSKLRGRLEPYAEAGWIGK